MFFMANGIQAAKNCSITASKQVTWSETYTTYPPAFKTKLNVCIIVLT